MEQIRNGFEDMLTMEQIKVYAKSEFGSSEMREIRMGFKDKLTMEQVSVYAKPEFNNCYQMEQIRLGFKNGLTMEQVKVYAKPEFRYDQMETIRERFEMDRSMEVVLESISA